MRQTVEENDKPAPEVTDDELAEELKKRAIAEAQEAVENRNRIDNMVNGMSSLLSQFEASNSEALGAAYTFAHRLTQKALEVDPSVAPVVRGMALRLVLNTADPRPIDANIQLRVTDDEAPTTE